MSKDEQSSERVKNLLNSFNSDAGYGDSPTNRRVYLRIIGSMIQFFDDAVIRQYQLPQLTTEISGESLGLYMMEYPDKYIETVQYLMNLGQRNAAVIRQNHEILNIVAVLIWGLKVPRCILARDLAPEVYVFYLIARNFRDYCEDLDKLARMTIGVPPPVIRVFSYNGLYHITATLFSAGYLLRLAEGIINMHTEAGIPLSSASYNDSGFAPTTRQSFIAYRRERYHVLRRYLTHIEHHFGNFVEDTQRFRIQFVDNDR